MRRVGLKHEVIRLHMENRDLSSPEIAAIINADDGYVRATLRRNGMSTQDARARRISFDHLAARTFNRLKEEALDRGITVPALCRKLLEIIASDKMVGAILDDADDMERAA